MKEEAADLGIELKNNFGSDIDYKFVDITTSDINEYPHVASILGRVRLPLTVINGEPRFHGGLSADMIGQAIKEVQENNNNG